MDDLRTFVESVVGSEPFRVEEVLGDGFVRLNVSEAEARQAKQDIQWVEDVVIELLRNSRDAHARHIYVATAREGDVRRICVLDDGDGIPQDLHERVFESRVTSKLDTFHADEWGMHGRGMAMYSIRRNVARAWVAASDKGLGASIAVEVDCAALRERADQSSWPLLQRVRHGAPGIVSGPHNIQRTVLEFALAERGLEVYYGSPLEIAALLYTDDPAHLGLRDLLSADPGSALPVCSRLRPAGDAPELRRRCAEIGLEISERSAYRVLSGSVAPARTALAQALSVQPQRGGHAPLELEHDYRGAGITNDDLKEFSEAVARAFEPIAQRYYVRCGQASAVLRGGAIHVTLPIEHDD